MRACHARRPPPRARRESTRRHGRACACHRGRLFCRVGRLMPASRTRRRNQRSRRLSPPVSTKRVEQLAAAVHAGDGAREPRGFVSRCSATSRSRIAESIAFSVSPRVNPNSGESRMRRSAVRHLKPWHRHDVGLGQWSTRRAHQSVGAVHAVHARGTRNSADAPAKSSSPYRRAPARPATTPWPSRSASPAVSARPNVGCRPCHGERTCPESVDQTAPFPLAAMRVVTPSVHELRGGDHTVLIGGECRDVVKAVVHLRSVRRGCDTTVVSHRWHQHGPIRTISLPAAGGPPGATPSG